MSTRIYPSNSHPSMFSNKTVRWTANQVYTVNDSYSSGCSEKVIMLALVVLGIAGIFAAFYHFYGFTPYDLFNWVISQLHVLGL